MSAGAFVTSKYAANNGTDIYAIRVQPETLAATFDSVANDAPTGAVNRPTRAKVSRSRGGYGVLPRRCTFKFTATPPTGYKADQSYTIPIMDEALWDTLLPGLAGTYLGVATEVISASPESIR